MSHEYPADEQLDKIKNWDFHEGWKSLIEYVEAIWWMPGWGFKVYKGRDRIYKKRCIKLQLHTAGWSGNESIIYALQQNFLFWSFSFWKEYTGGHYWFEISTQNWKGHKKEASRE